MNVAELTDVLAWVRAETVRPGAEPPWKKFGRWWAGQDESLRAAVNAELARVWRERGERIAGVG